MANSGDLFGCHSVRRGWGRRELACATGIWWAAAREAAKYPTMPKIASHNKVLSSLKCEVSH